MVLTDGTPFGVIGDMELKAFVKSLANESQRENFAAKCATTIGHMRNVMNGHRTCGPELAVAIERESCRSVTRQELCPNWQDIWPELLETARA